MMSSQRHAVGQRIIIEGLFLGPVEWMTCEFKNQKKELCHPTLNLR